MFEKTRRAIKEQIDSWKHTKHLGHGKDGKLSCPKCDCENELKAALAELDKAEKAIKETGNERLKKVLVVVECSYRYIQSTTLKMNIPYEIDGELTLKDAQKIREQCEKRVCRTYGAVKNFMAVILNLIPLKGDERQ